MLKKSVAIIALCTLLGACVTEPRDPDFAGAEGINKDAAAKNRVSLGLTYLSNGNFSQAKANLDKALNFAPQSADAHFAMAYYYQQVDELVLAEEYYFEALKLAPENPNIINSYGAFLCEEGRYEKAKSYFLKAVSSKSYVSTAETYENLAICAVDQGKTDEAIEFFQSALNHQPTRGKSLFLLAQLQKDQGNFGEAKKTLWKYDRVSRLSPESLWLSYEIAIGLGDTKSALGYGELMKSMFPEHPNTAIFKQQMGKFQPVATVTNKRRTVQSELAATPAQSAAELSEKAADKAQVVIDSTSDATISGAATADGPSMIKMNKKAKTLSPNDAVDAPVSAEASIPETPIVKEVVAEIVAQTVAQVEDTNDAVQQATPDALQSTDALSASEAAQREAELEAALAAEFTSQVNNSASIEGTASKVNDALAIADDAPEVETVAAAAKTETVIDKVADENAKYHIVLPKENLYRISLRYNVKMKYLMQWNNLDDPSAIRIGMKLRVKDPKNND